MPLLTFLFLMSLVVGSREVRGPLFVVCHLFISQGYEGFVLIKDAVFDTFEACNGVCQGVLWPCPLLFVFLCYL